LATPIGGTAKNFQYIFPSSHIRTVYAMNVSRQKRDIDEDQKKAKYSH
jgi:hypothetical protein